MLEHRVLEISLLFKEFDLLELLYNLIFFVLRL
jgi:hypothetical protein